MFGGNLWYCLKVYWIFANYLRLRKIEKGNKIRDTQTLFSCINGKKYQSIIIKVRMLPLIENSIKHENNWIRWSFPLHVSPLTKYTQKVIIFWRNIRKIRRKSIYPICFWMQEYAIYYIECAICDGVGAIAFSFADYFNFPLLTI